MSNWLILGCGYVGSALARTLLPEGIGVWAVRRSADALADLRAGGVRTVAADLATDEWHWQVPEEFDVVVQCASASGGGLQGYERAYVQGNQSLLRWLEGGARAGRILYTSSTTVYPQADGSWVKEDQAGGDLTATAERILASERVLCGSGWKQRVAILRLAGIYGPGRHYLLDAVASCTGPLAGRGDYYLNLIHRDDIVSGLRLAGDGDWEGPLVINLADDKPFLREDIVRWVAGQLGKPFPGFDPESSVGRRPRVNSRGEFPNRRISNMRAKTALGWSPKFRDFRDGYRELLSGREF